MPEYELLLRLKMPGCGELWNDWLDDHEFTKLSGNVQAGFLPGYFSPTKR
jgi:hypothetical protein